MIRTIGYLDWVGLKSYQGLFSSSFGLRRQVQLKCKRVSRDKDKGQGVKEERETLQYVSDFRHSCKQKEEKGCPHGVGGRMGSRRIKELEFGTLKFTL